MKGSYFDRNCAFYLGDSDVMIAQVSAKSINLVSNGNISCMHACFGAYMSANI
jgi:hypothetical protein